MNLTYFDDDFYSYDDARRSTNLIKSRPAITRELLSANEKAAASGVGTPQLGGFFSSVANFVKTTTSAPLKATQALIQGGPSAALAQTKADFRSGAKSAAGFASVVAPVASVFGPIGKIVALGLTGVKLKVDSDKAKATADYQLKQAAAQQLQQTSGDVAALLQQYAQIAGNIPGRIIGASTMKQLVAAALQSGLIAASTGQWPDMVNDFYDATDNSCATNAKHRCPQGLAVAVKNAVSAGVFDPQQILTQFWAPKATEVTGAHGNWIMPTDPMAKQILIDAIDQLVAQQNPSAPFTYGINPDPAQEVALPAPIPTTTAAASLAPITTGLVQNLPPVINVSVPASPPALQAAGIDPATSAMIQKMMDQMAAQNATSAQMQAAAMQALAASGANVNSPAVQQAAVADVNAAKVVSAGTSVNPWVLGGLAVAAVLFATARPARGGRRK